MYPVFSGDVLVIQIEESVLQESFFIIPQISKQYTVKITTAKTKVISFRGNVLTRTKIILNDQITEEMNDYNCPGNYIGNNKNYYVNKLGKLQMI